MYYLYILKSVEHSRSYTGTTKDVKDRLESHNTGRVESTKHWHPWLLVHTVTKNRVDPNS